ncbi:ATP-grasp domain-containing protein [Buchnera aphidicola]
MDKPPLKLDKKLKKFNIPIIGTNSKTIDITEDRNQFQKIVSLLKLKKPDSTSITTTKDELEKSKIIQYPIMVRPSYVSDGQSMKIIYYENDLNEYFHNTCIPSINNPILIDKYLENSIEIDVDLVCNMKHVLIGGIMEHIEPAGIQSGNSSCTLPTYTINNKIKENIKNQTIKLALTLCIKGLMNVQIAIQNQNIYIIEINPRASRTIPFISKITSIPLAKIAAKVMIGKSLKQQKFHDIKIKLSHFFVKESILPFNKFLGIDPILGPEMRSTGEVMGIGKTFYSTFSKKFLVRK